MRERATVRVRVAGDSEGQCKDNGKDNCKRMNNARVRVKKRKRLKAKAKDKDRI